MSASNRTIRWILVASYCLACIEFVHFYEVMTPLWVHLPLYLAGTERLPYQTRVLPIAFMWPMLHRHMILVWVTGHGWHSAEQIGETAELNAFFLWSLLSFFAASFYCMKLYRAVCPNGKLALLVLPTFLYVSIWSYTLHVYRNVSYPYDISSLAFFTAGLLYIYQRRFWPLVAVMLLGTLNRETTLFLILLFVLDGIQPDAGEPAKDLLFRIRAAPWLRTALLLAIWCGIRLTMMHIFGGNDRSETYDRFRENLQDISLKHLPGMLNLCGYLLPIVWLLRKHVHPERFGSYAIIIPFWIAVMAWKGLLLESRIHGELGGYVAVASVLLLERYITESGVMAPETIKPAS
jgi:hypothetical protein